MMLVCPRCRAMRPEGLRVRRLLPGRCTWLCPEASCGAVYPVVEGVPVVFRQPPGTWGDAALAERLAERYAEAWGPGERPNGVRERLSALIAPRPCGGTALDLCGGVGLAAGLLARAFDEVVWLDAWLPLLLTGRPRLPPGVADRVKPLCADALDPPLFAEAFDLVYLGAALDSVREPWLLLGQADALLVPGGLLVAATPFAWDDAVTPPGARPGGPPALRAALAGRVPGLGHLSYRVLEEAAGLPWSLRREDDGLTVFAVDWVVAQKDGAAEESPAGDPNGI